MSHQSQTKKENRLKYFIFFKPYGVLSQFTDKEGRPTLSDFGPLAKDVYSIGRLDADSEGLLLLSNDGKLKHLLLDPKFRHPRTYLIQVERIPSEESLEKLRKGIIIEKEKTLPSKIRLLDKDPDLPRRPVPIRFRKNVPTSWLELTLYEGKNRQVRKMTAAVGHPTLRLVRIKMGSLVLGSLKPGEIRSLTKEEIEKLKNICSPRRR
ncbi:MAG: pseudouridine synthase [Bacteroidota bacterium]|nr:pseudouridine synthase [Bacteroidota bacterium]